MPENTVYVGRPGRWGNPFKIEGDMIYGNASHRRKIFDPWIYIELSEQPCVNKCEDFKDFVIALYENWLNGKDENFIIPPPTIEEVQKELKGKNLACWCKKGNPCHADILLKIANS